MKFFLKNCGNNTGEAFIEEWCVDDWDTVCISKVIFVGDECLVDTIDTPKQYRRKGYASQLVKELQARFKEVKPIGITSSEEARGFWDRLGMEDGMGDEEDG